MMIQREPWFRAGGLNEDFQRLVQELASTPSNTDALLQLMHLSERSGLEVPPEVLEPAVRAWVERAKALPATPENLQAFKDVLQVKWPLSRYVGHKDEAQIRDKVVEILGLRHAQEGKSPDALKQLWVDALETHRLPPIPWTLAKRRSPSVSIVFSILAEVRALVERGPAQAPEGATPTSPDQVFAGEGFITPRGTRNMDGVEAPQNRWHLNLASFFSGLHKMGYQPKQEVMFERTVTHPVNGRQRVGELASEWTRAHVLEEDWRPHVHGIRVDGKEFPTPSYDDPMWHKWFQESSA